MHSACRSWQSSPQARSARTSSLLTFPASICAGITGHSVRQRPGTLGIGTSIGFKLGVEQPAVVRIKSAHSRRRGFMRTSQPCEVLRKAITRALKFDATSLGGFVFDEQSSNDGGLLLGKLSGCVTSGDSEPVLVSHAASQCDQHDNGQNANCQRLHITHPYTVRTRAADASRGRNNAALGLNSPSPGRIASGGSGRTRRRSRQRSAS